MLRWKWSKHSWTLAAVLSVLVGAGAYAGTEHCRDACLAFECPSNVTSGQNASCVYYDTSGNPQFSCPASWIVSYAGARHSCACCDAKDKDCDDAQYFKKAKPRLTQYRASITRLSLRVSGGSGQCAYKQNDICQQCNQYTNWTNFPGNCGCSYVGPK